MEENKLEPVRGVGALLSVLIVSALLLLLVVLASTHVALLATELNDSQAYQEALASVWSCNDMALTRLRIDPARFDSGPAAVTFADGRTCQIISATVSSTSARVTAGGHSNQSFVTIEVTASRTSSTAPFHIETWREY